MNFDPGNFDENFDVHQFREVAFFRFTSHFITHHSTDLLSKNPVGIWAINVFSSYEVAFYRLTINESDNYVGYMSDFIKYPSTHS